MFDKKRINQWKDDAILFLATTQRTIIFILGIINFLAFYSLGIISIDTAVKLIGAFCILIMVDIFIWPEISTWLRKHRSNKMNNKLSVKEK